ncbi:MAG: hypothetical protein KAU14_09610, partial [Thermoplasmata archaeon]|nr:hypothetical protein [Thermoplasmata archaeon]
AVFQSSHISYVENLDLENTPPLSPAHAHTEDVKPSVYIKKRKKRITTTPPPKRPSSKNLVSFYMEELERDGVDNPHDNPSKLRKIIKSQGFIDQRTIKKHLKAVMDVWDRDHGVESTETSTITGILQIVYSDYQDNGKWNLKYLKSDECVDELYSKYGLDDAQAIRGVQALQAVYHRDEPGGGGPQ